MKSMAFGSKLELQAGSWLEAVYDVVIGVVVGASHSLNMLRKNTMNSAFIGWIFEYLGFERHVGGKSTTNTEGLKVVAVGYGRTGTYSLTLALEELGYPTLHTQHLYENEDIISMWSNDVFLPSLAANKAEMGKPDLNLIASRFSATADLPMALYFEQVMEEFPDCKFVLTTRDNSEAWFRSWDTLTKSITQPAHLGSFFFTNAVQYMAYYRWLFSIVNKDETYLTSDFPFPNQNKEHAIASYEEHNRRVRETIPSDRLLEYSVKEGWQPLCEFLEISDCPQTPFPKTNSARSVRVQSISAFIAPLIIVLFVLFYSFANVFRKTTGKSVVQWTIYESKRLLIKLQHVIVGGEKLYWTDGVSSVNSKKLV